MRWPRIGRYCPTWMVAFVAVDSMQRRTYGMPGRGSGLGHTKIHRGGLVRPCRGDPARPHHLQDPPPAPDDARGRAKLGWLVSLLW